MVVSKGGRSPSPTAPSLNGEDSCGRALQAGDGPADEPAGGLGGDTDTLADLAEALALTVEQPEAGLHGVTDAFVERAN